MVVFTKNTPDLPIPRVALEYILFTPLVEVGAVVWSARFKYPSTLMLLLSAESIKSELASVFATTYANVAASISNVNIRSLKGGTYTVTNVGTFGNVMGTPIINQPQVAILALGAIRKVPAVIETPEGDFIGIRQKMFLSHSYDHRVVDGSLGGQFVRRVADYLEQFDINREL